MNNKTALMLLGVAFAINAWPQNPAARPNTVGKPDPFVPRFAPDKLGPIVWVKIAEPMERMTWHQVDDIRYIDQECRSDNYLPRVCLYRHISQCRVLTTDPPTKIPRSQLEEISKMCSGWFPEPVLLRREFSNPLYLPNQAPPSADPRFQFAAGVEARDREIARKLEEVKTGQPAGVK
jgi:hypothetical protein